MTGEDEFHDDNPPPPPPPPVTPTQQSPHTLSTIKLPILKKDTNRQIRVLPPKTAEEILARERERKARTTLLMSIPEDHLAKFHKMTNAKEMWEAIKSRFGGNDKSKKMFQSLLSQLEIHGAGVSTEDANQKFLRSLPASWSQVSLITRTKPGVDTLSFDDLYNNLRIFESDVKGSTGSSSSTQNVAFVSSESTSSTNDVSTAYGVSTSSGHNSQREGSSSYTDELTYSFFANQSSGPQLDHEDLEQVDEFDLEEMDLKWQVAMISMRLKKFYKNTGRKLQFDAKEPVGFDKTKVECFNCHNTGHFARECRSKGNQESRRRDAGNTGYKAKDNGRRPGKQEEPKALVTIDKRTASFLNVGAEQLSVVDVDQFFVQWILFFVSSTKVIVQRRSVQAEYDVESMPDDEILSISKDDEELDDSDKELIVADEVVADTVLDEILTEINT
ncbi:ribonuclease H-like domain-containing protein [Tanacetum coccineum]